jgi:hypothetical protein
LRDIGGAVHAGAMDCPRRLPAHSSVKSGQVLRFIENCLWERDCVSNTASLRRSRGGVRIDARHSLSRFDRSLKISGPDLCAQGSMPI